MDDRCVTANCSAGADLNWRRIVLSGDNGCGMRRRWALGFLVTTLLTIGGIAALAPTATMNVPSGGPLAGTERGYYDVSWAAAQNKPMDSEALARTKQYRDYSVWKDIPSDRVLVRVQTAFSPGTSTTPLPQAAFPLDWSRAQRARDDWGFEVWQLMFAVNQIPYAVVAHIGPDASAYDRAAVRAAVVSIRP
jgi:hypothetical protein